MKKLKLFLIILIPSISYSYNNQITNNTDVNVNKYIQIVDRNILRNNNNVNKSQIFIRRGTIVYGSNGSIEKIIGNLLCSKTKCAPIY
jgi:hypothetical protein